MCIVIIIWKQVKSINFKYFTPISETNINKYFTLIFEAEANTILFSNGSIFKDALYVQSQQKVDENQY